MAKYLTIPQGDTDLARAKLHEGPTLSGLTNGTAYVCYALSDPSAAFTPQAVSDELSLALSGVAKVGNKVQITASAALVSFAASIDNAPQIITPVSDTVLEVLLDREGVLTVSATAEVGNATLTQVVAAPSPIVSVSYSVGTGSDVQVTVNRAGRLSWLVSASPTVSTITDPLGQADVSVTGGSITIEDIAATDNDQYLHVALTAGGETSPVVSVLFMLKEDTSQGEIAKYTFNAGMPAGLSVERASIGDRLTPDNIYQFAGENSPRIHWEDAVVSRLLLTPAATKISPTSNITLIGGATSADSDTLVRIGTFQTYVKNVTMGAAYSDQVRIGALAVPFSAIGEVVPYSFEFSIHWIDKSAPLWIDIGNGNTSALSDTNTTFDGILIKFDMQNLTHTIQIAETSPSQPYVYGKSPAIRISKGIADFYTIRIAGLLSKETSGSAYLTPKFLSPKPNIVAGFDYTNKATYTPVGSITSPIQLPDTSMSNGAGDAGVTVNNTLRGSRAAETLVIANQLGSVDVRINHLFGKVDMTNQALNGDWRYAPEQPLQISSIEIYPVGGLPQ